MDRAVEEKYCKVSSEGSQTIINGLSMIMLSDIAWKTLKSEESNKTIMGLLMSLLYMPLKFGVAFLHICAHPSTHLFSWTAFNMVIFQAQCKTLRVSTRALWWSW